MSTYSTSLQLQLIGNGEQTGTWGTTTNTNWNLVEQAVAGVTSITMINADYTLTVVNGASDEARNMVLVVGGTNSAIRKVIAPLVTKVYVVYNNTSGGYAITVGGSTGSAVTVPNGASTLIYCDGTNFYGGLTGTTGNWSVPGTVTATTFSGAGTGLTGTASSLTVGNAAYAVAAVTASNAAAATNLSGGNTGYVPYQSSAGSTSLLPPGTAGQVLATGGAGAAPYWTTVSGGGGGTVTSVTGTGTVSGLTLSGNVTTSGNITLGGTLSITSGQVTTALGYTPADSSTTVTTNTTQTISGGKTFTGGVVSQAYNYTATGTSSFTQADGTGSLIAFSTQNSASSSDYGVKFTIGNSGNSQSIICALNTRPNDDNTKSLGTGTYRWSVVYAATGTINTSDANTKTEIADLDDAEKRVAQRIKGLIKKFKFKDAVADKGDNARIHVGVIAQEVEAAFTAEGLDAHRYGLFCEDSWDDAPAILEKNGKVFSPEVKAGSRKGIRYDELLAFVIAAI